MGRLHWSGGPFGYLAFTIVFAVAGTLLAAGPAFIESVGDELAADAVATLSDDAAVVTLQGFAQFTPELTETLGSVEQALADVDGLRDPVTTFALGDSQTVAIGQLERFSGVLIFARQGAVESLDLVADGGPDGGVMVSETLAERIGLAPGDTFVVASRPWELEVTVRGVYRDIADNPGPYWRGIPGELLPQGRSIFGGIILPELLVADEAALGTIVAGSSVSAGSDVDGQQPDELFAGRVWFEAYRGPVDGIVALRTLSDEVSGLEAMAQDVGTELGIIVAQAGVRGLTMRTELSDLRDDVEGALDATEPAIGVVAVTAGIIGLVVVGLGAWFVARRRERDLRIWRVEGRSPLAVAALSGLGAAPAALGGTVVGALAAPFLIGAFGPSGIAHAETIPVGWLAAFAVAGLGTVAGATAMVAAEVSEVSSSHRRRGVWDLALYAGAAVLVAQALLRSGGIDSNDLDLVTLLVPLTAIAAVVMAGLRLLGWAVRRTRTQSSRLSPPALLAWRRTTAALGSRLGIMLPIGLATGVALFAAGLVTSTDTALATKARVIVGGDVAFTMIEPVQVAPAGSTAVRASTVSTQTGSRLWLVVLDPDNYEEAVGWLPDFGTDADSFLAALAPSADGRIPVIAAGPGAGELATTGGARFQRLAMSYEIVGSIDAIPSMSSDQPTLAMRSDALLAWAERNPIALPAFVDPENIDLGRLLRGMQYRLVASSSAADAVREQAEAVGGRVRAVMTTSDVTTRPEFSSQRWAFDFLRLIALAALVLAFVVFLFTMAEGRKRLVIADALTKRMGIGKAASSAGLALEIVVLVVVSMLMGAVAAGGLSLLLLSRFDPLPDVRPLLEFALPWADLVVVAGTGLLLAAVTWGWTLRATRRLDPAEVLRG